MCKAAPQHRHLDWSVPSSPAINPLVQTGICWTGAEQLQALDGAGCGRCRVRPDGLPEIQTTEHLTVHALLSVFHGSFHSLRSSMQ
ncbi:uncharacterized protein WM294_006217 isoform 2-T2 [Sarcoramphus papa]